MPPWEALLEIFLNFGVPLGAEGAPFWLKKASFVRSDFLMLLVSARDPFWEGSAAEAGPPERLEAGLN